jgi:MSHA biogenesis protein MshQ
LIYAALVFASVHAEAAIVVTGAKSATTGSTTATSLGITPVSGAARADLLVAQVTLDDSSATITKPSGWSELTAVALSSSGIQQHIYWAIRSNAEPASYIWNFSKAVKGTVILTDITGVDTSLPINASAGGTGSGATLQAPEIASGYQNGVLLAFFGTTGAAGSISPQNSMTLPSGAQANAVAAGAGVQVAFAYEQLASAGLTGVRTATGASGNFIGQSVALTAASSQTCFTDNFTRASLGSDWVASTKGSTAYTPNINSSSRLRFTDATGNEATLATLQRYFPAAGNNVVVTFNHYAYGGSGADGLVTVFSDATVPPVAGAVGGSLGYTGFAGAWLGIGLDEFGNFSSTIGGYKGPQRIINSIAVRGPANSFHTTSPANGSTYGNPYLAGTATLNPVVGYASGSSTLGPGYLYRISIDSRVPGEQWVQVERSTDGGTTYSALISYFNAIASLATIFTPIPPPTIPSNFWLSFSAGTGGSTNIHEIDNLSVCATKMVASTPSIDHFRFENPGTMDTCQPATIKVTACTVAEPTCTPFTGGDVQVTLKPTGWVSGDTVKLIGGAGTLQLAQTATGTVTLDIDKTKTVWPALINAGTYASKCVLPGTSTATSCNLSVTAASAGLGLTFPNASQLACDDSGDILIKACSGGYANQSKNLQFWYSHTDPATPADATRVVTLSKDAWANSVNLSTTTPSSASSPAVVPVTFDGTGTARFRLKYADVGKMTLQVRDAAATTVVGSKTFIVRPAGFAVTSITDMSLAANPVAVDASGAKFVAAGSSFKATVEARNNCATPAVTKNFGSEIAPEGVIFDSALATGLGLTDNPALATVTDFSFVNGTGTATLAWPEVGILKLTPRLKSGAYMGTSDVMGTATGNVGRFYADRLDTAALTQGCSSGAFTYNQQPFPSVTVTAKAAGGSTALKNYQGSSTAAFSFAKPVTLADTTGKGVLTFNGSATIPVTAFSSGSALLNNADANHPLAKFAFNTNPTQPSTIVIAAADTDGGGGTVLTANATVRSGRLRMQNVYGSERLPLAVPIEAQYWSGSYWATNLLDFCTSVPMSSITMGPYYGALSACNTQISSTGSQTLGAGRLSITLSKPSLSGSVDMALNTSSTATGGTCIAAAPSPATAAAMAWFGANPSARATFGVYKSPLIYRRENY